MKNYLLIMRPSHWSKNIFVFVGLIFGGKLAGPMNEVLLAIGSAIGGFFCFCLASASIYIFNDIIDRDRDKLHPEKRNRPIAAGDVPIGTAAVISIICAAAAIVSSYMLARSLAIVVVAYILLMVLYSLVLRRMMILDCIAISIGFCLRAVAGAIVVGVFISPWLIICTFALCLFLGFGKRRSEVEQLTEESRMFRRTLTGYTPELLGHMLDVSSGLAIVCFLLYATDERTLRVFGTNNLVYTTPLVLYCIFRFSALIQKGKYSGPVQLILRDLPFQVGFALWAISCMGIVYGNKLGISIGSIWAY